MMLTINWAVGFFTSRGACAHHAPAFIRNIANPCRYLQEPLTVPYPGTFLVFHLVTTTCGYYVCFHVSPWLSCHAPECTLDINLSILVHGYLFMTFECAFQRISPSIGDRF